MMYGAMGLSRVTLSRLLFSRISPFPHYVDFGQDPALLLSLVIISLVIVSSSRLLSLSPMGQNLPGASLACQEPPMESQESPIAISS
jgi:hypothetical protein